MRCFWIPWSLSVLGWAAELVPPPTPEASTANPKSFAASHYELLMEYSPFVKSLESAKETEKSPDLVVVGYGRMKGVDHVIVQQRENSEKREKISSRYGSKDFPYRLLSVTNTSDRRSFLAVLEDRNKKKYKISYASEASPPPGLVTGGAGASQAAPLASGNHPAAAGRLAPAPAQGNPLINPSIPTTSENLQIQIQNLEAKINDPSTPELTRQKVMEVLDTKKKQLESLQSPQELTSPEIVPGKAP